MNVCSRCIVSEHRGHKINDKDEGSVGASSQQNFVRKSQILLKKIDASTSETTMFEEELNEIAEQLRVMPEFIAINSYNRDLKSLHCLSWTRS